MFCRLGPHLFPEEEGEGRIALPVDCTDIIATINSGKRSEWSQIRSAIIQVNHEYDHRPTLDDTKSTYQLIIKIRIFEKHKKYNTFNEIIMLEYKISDH